MQISRQNLKNISPSSGVVIPSENIFSLPEKVLQFGTGVLLRGLPDYFIDKANRQGIFNGRIVMIKSTVQGSTDEFDEQDNLYTLCVRGVEDGRKIEDFIINSSTSRVLPANEDWDAILRCAYNPELKIIISNTTEVGIILSEDDIHSSPPHSFPGKLLSFLFERYKAFKGSKESGMVIIPTELLVDNGSKLRSIILELASMNKLDSAFTNWLATANYFCSSLVDRIVPGKLSATDQVDTEKRLGYSDKLMIMAECFCLWAIESDNKYVKEILSFAKIDDGLVISPDIEIFRELKLRLLNGTHSFSCGLAFLAGFKTVKDAMNDPHFISYVQDLAQNEIAEAISSPGIVYADAFNFAKKIIDRFRNPFIDHLWINIAVQYSEKMKQRNIPVLVRHYGKYSHVPEHMALGFAGFLLFMKCHRNAKGDFVGEINGTQYPVQDDYAEYFARKWNQAEADEAIDKILGDKEFWGTDLSLFNGFVEAVKKHFYLLTRNGVIAAISQTELNKTVA